MTSPRDADSKKTWFRAYPTVSQAAAMRALSARTRVPMQVYIREAIDHVLSKYENESKS